MFGRQLGIIVIAGASVVGCGGSDNSGGSATDAPHPASEQRCVDACKAISDAEAKSLLGDVDPPGASAGMCVKGADATTSSCHWKHDSSSNNFSLSLSVYSESDATFDTLRKIQQASPGYTEIAGVGDAAFKGTLGVMVSGQAQIFFRVDALTFQLIYTQVGGAAPTDIDSRLKTEAIAVVNRASSL